MAWYVLQVLTAKERNVCEALRHKGVKAKVLSQYIEIRRQGQWKSEEQLLFPGYVFVSAEYSAFLFHLVSPIAGVIRWLGMEHGLPQALDMREVLRWKLDRAERLEPSRVLFLPNGTWHVLDGPLQDFACDVMRMERRQRRALVCTRLGGSMQRIRFAITPVKGGT